MVSFVRSDHVGRPVLATNAAGEKVRSAGCFPFCGVRVSTGTPFTARFPGQWFKSENDLQQNGMREYGPATRRYPQGDPLGLVDGVGQWGWSVGLVGGAGRWGGCLWSGAPRARHSSGPNRRMSNLRSLGSVIPRRCYLRWLRSACAARCGRGEDGVRAGVGVYPDLRHEMPRSGPTRPLHLALTRLTQSPYPAASKKDAPP